MLTLVLWQHAATAPKLTQQSKVFYCQGMSLAVYQHHKRKIISVWPVNNLCYQIILLNVMHLEVSS